MTDMLTMFRSLQTCLESHRPAASEPPDDTMTPFANHDEHLQHVSATVLTGFLGAGKSTLLAALLSSPPGELKINAVVNDVGSLDFDPALQLADGSLDVELSNGCGCCAASGPLREAVERAAISRATGSAPDLVVVEASGLTDPFAVAHLIDGHPGLQLDRIVAVVNGVSLTTQLDQPTTRPTVLRQLAAADVVLVSRADRLNTTELSETIELVAGLAPGRVVAASTLGQPPLEYLVPGSSRGVADPMMRSAVALDHPAVVGSFVQRQTLDTTTLECALASRPTDILRCKGHLVSSEGPVVLQATSSDWSIAPTALSPSQPGAVLIVGVSDTAVDAFAGSIGLIRQSSRPD